MSEGLDEMSSADGENIFNMEHQKVFFTTFNTIDHFIKDSKILFFV